ncbi:MAG: Na(+)/H(+) antiporter subunit D [Planctomycetota bacterium]
MVSSIPPFFIFMLGALFMAVARRETRPTIMLAVPLVGLLHLWNMSADAVITAPLLDFELVLYKADRLTFLFGVLFHIAAFIGGLFSLHIDRPGQDVACLLYAGAAIGAVGAGDMITLFLFWEVMAVSSVYLIWGQQSARSWKAGMRYLLWQVISGLILLAGIGAYYAGTKSIAITEIGLDAPGGWLIFLGIGTKACFPFLHNWLIDGYPEATPTGAVWLSSFTTKAAVYGMARMFPGTQELIVIGAVMAAFPIFYAVIENDMRRVLGYSMINQIGFMLVGIGIGTPLGINGAVAHAFNDVIFKGLLFMTMGVVLQQTGRIHASDLGGLAKSMPWTAKFCMVGAASISAFPLFSGFVSKSMIMSAAAENHLYWVWFILLFAAAGVFHHAGIKIPFFAFYGHDAKIKAEDPPTSQLLAMATSAILCVLIGCFPQLLYGLLPFETDYNPYDVAHVVTQVQLLLFSALAFTWLQRSGLYPPELHSTNLDSDWFVRRLGSRAWGQLSSGGRRLLDQGSRNAQAWVAKVDRQLRRHRGPYGVLSKTWPTGAMMLGVAVLLVSYLLLYYVQ